MKSRCENCGKPYLVKRRWQRWCSPRCRFEGWVIRQVVVRIKDRKAQRSTLGRLGASSVYCW